MKIYDITATISENLPTYDGKRPEVKDLLSLKNGDVCNFSVVKISTHTGTHADMPLHFIDETAGCDTVDLSHFFGKAKVFKLKNVRAHVSKADLIPLDIGAGDIVLLETGQSKYMSDGEFKKDYFALTIDAAEYLVERKIKTVGIDYLSIDPYDRPDFPAHKKLLSSGITLLEGLVLENVPEGQYILSALPLKILGGNGSPVRAVLAEI